MNLFRTFKSSDNIDLADLKLVLLFLAIAFGSFIFVYFLNTSDVVKAQNMYTELMDLYQKFNRFCNDIENCKELIVPKTGSSSECIFSLPVQHLVSLEKVGFIFKNKSCYFVRYSQNNEFQIPQKYKNYSNPLLDGNILEGCFTRISQSLLEVKLKVQLKSMPNTLKEVKRLIYLKNL